MRRIANMSGSQRSRCSGEPSSTMLPIARPLCTPKKVAIDVSTREISRVTKLVSSRLRRWSPRPVVAQTDNPELAERRYEVVRELGSRPLVVGDRGDLALQPLAQPQQHRLVLDGQHLLIAVQVAGQRRQNRFPHRGDSARRGTSVCGHGISLSGGAGGAGGSADISVAP